MLWRVILFATVILSPQFLFPPQGHSQVTCGSSITTDTGLIGDLDCSNYQYDPLHIDADNVTFKLNGYTLTCSSQWGWYYTQYELDVEGIRATGRTGVKILGPGKIANCGRAVTFDGGSNNEVRALYIAGNLTGIVLQLESGSIARYNVIISNLGNGIEMSWAANVQLLQNYVAANGGDPSGSRGFGVTNDNTSVAAISGNKILGNQLGGIAEVGASVLSAQITENIILGNGGYDLNLRGTDDTVTETSCETSVPAGLCPYPHPRFPSEKSPKDKGKGNK